MLKKLLQLIITLTTCFLFTQNLYSLPGGQSHWRPGEIITTSNRDQYRLEAIIGIGGGQDYLASFTN